MKSYMPQVQADSSREWLSVFLRQLARERVVDF
jgi:hypothetical protein